MEIEEISKTFLIAYKNIPRMIKSLDKCINHSVMSGLGCSHIYNGITTDMLYEKIIVFKNRQDILATVYDLTKNILLKMDSKNAKLLIAKYIYKMSNKQIIEKFDCSSRSMFRYLKKALNEFGYYLKVFGYSDDVWFRGELFLENIIEYLPEVDNEKKEEKVNKSKNYLKYDNMNDNVVLNIVLPTQNVASFL